MSSIILNCQIKAPVHLKLPLGGGSHDAHVIKSGCQVIDIVTSTDAIIDCITLTNHYTHKLLIKYLDVQTASSSKWKTCMEEKTLMPDCHSEVGSQSRFSYKLQLVKRIKSLRLILRQPSLNWNEFGVHDVTLYGRKSSSIENEKEEEDGDVLEMKMKKMAEIMHETNSIIDQLK
jgi:hypothetical protein